MRHLTLTSRQRTRAADLLEKAAIAALIPILGADHSSVWLRVGAGCLTLLLALAAIRVEGMTERRR